MFRRVFALLFCLLLTIMPVMAGAATTIACYTGPGYEYDTLDFTLTEGVDITCYYLAYDSKGSPWVQVEVKQGTNLLRVYLPKDNVIGDLSMLTVEKRAAELNPQMLAWLYLTDACVPRLGPGTHFNRLNYTLTTQTEGVIILFENNWGLLEIDQGNGRLIRMWLPKSELIY